jgi:hypothetical protein
MNNALQQKRYAFEPASMIDGVRVGKIVTLDGQGRVFVDFADNGRGPLAARYTGSLKTERLREAAAEGRDVLLVFENGDPELPIIIDVMHSLLDDSAASPELVLEAEKSDDVLIDGQRVTFDAREEIVLRCGKSSITLTKAGKILIRGAYLLSRSSGVNRIKGGSVQIN